MYLEQVDSTHCSPLPKEKFHLPPYQKIQKTFDSILNLSQKKRLEQIQTTKERKKYNIMGQTISKCESILKYVLYCTYKKIITVLSKNGSKSQRALTIKVMPTNAKMKNFCYKKYVYLHIRCYSKVSVSHSLAPKREQTRSTYHSPSKCFCLLFEIFKKIILKAINFVIKPSLKYGFFKKLFH